MNINILLFDCYFTCVHSHSFIDFAIFTFFYIHMYIYLIYMYIYHYQKDIRQCLDDRFANRYRFSLKSLENYLPTSISFCDYFSCL